MDPDATALAAAAAAAAEAAPFRVLFVEPAGETLHRHFIDTS